MDEDDIWLSVEEDEDEGYLGASTNPIFFDLAVTYQGLPGVEHVAVGQRQRTAISVFHEGSTTKPAVTVSCNAKAMTHGITGPPSKKLAMLLGYKFKFHSYQGTRIKKANILFEFHPKEGQTAGHFVAQAKPRRLHKMEETPQNESSKLGLELNIGSKFSVVDAGPKTASEESVKQVTMHHTVITGDDPQSDDWGNSSQARFSLLENKSQKSVIASKLIACILLERDHDEDFVCVLYINVTPNYAAVVTSVFFSKALDDPISFSIDEATFDKLDGKVEIHINNLGLTNLDKLWNCTMYDEYADALKPPKPRKEPKKDNNTEDKREGCRQCSQYSAAELA
ncbi:hypothetical protein MMC15_007101 [Xylographa vitiligo]|nr:hypothetical protein [Xylographa vitiligo]